MLAFNPSTQRLTLWDGRRELTRAVLEGRAGLEVPEIYSVVKLEGVELKQAGRKWSVAAAGYCLLRQGGLMGGKIWASVSIPYM